MCLLVSSLNLKSTSQNFMLKNCQNYTFIQTDVLYIIATIKSKEVESMDQTKQDIHILIESIDDPKMLENLKTIVASYVIYITVNQEKPS